MMTTIETYVRRGRGMVRKWAVNPGVRLGVKIGVYALSGFLLSAAALANSPMPLVMGLVCALTGWEAAVLAVGGAAGRGLGGAGTGRRVEPGQAHSVGIAAADVRRGGIDRVGDGIGFPDFSGGYHRRAGVPAAGGAGRGVGQAV